MATLSSDITQNGETSSANDGMSAAQRLQALHEAQEAHKTTVEEVEDEEDTLHPPPSKAAAHSSVATPDAPQTETATMSAKAAGKQKAEEPKKTSTVLDTQSEENFPSLGGPKPRTQAPSWGAQAPAWAAKKNIPSRPAVNGGMNGVSPAQQPVSTLSSRASTPSSGIMSPSPSNAPGTPQPYGSRTGPQMMSIPGRFTDHIQLAPSQMAKNKVAKPVLDDINRKSKARVNQRAGPNQSVIFEGTGPQEAVRQALKQISQQLGVQQTIKVPVPVSVRPHIIGKGGAIIQSIMQQTGARIQVPKTEDTFKPEEEDDSSTIDVEITGDPIAVGEARRKVEEIASSRTSTVNLRLKEIPPEFFPFIAGPHNQNLRSLERENLRVDVPQYHTWQHRPPPQMPRANERPAFIAHPDLHIRLAGDRNAAQEARLAIERQVEQLRQQLLLDEQNIHRAQHQFIIGERGISLHDFLEQTGCTVVLPPDSDKTENITIIGPADQLEAGISKAQELAAEMQMSSIDLGRYHNNAPNGADAHAQALTRYLISREIVAELDRMHNAHVVVPSSFDGPVDWQIFSREGKNALQARNDIVKIIQAHPPSRIAQVQADPFFHSHVQSQYEDSMLSELGVRMILPTEDETDGIVLVYEGIPEPGSQYSIPRQRPTSPEALAFEEALRQAQNQISSFIMADQQDLSTRDLEVPRKFHDKVKKYVNQQPQPTPPHGFPVDVNYGPSRRAATQKQPSRSDSISLRGPTAHVGALEAQILEFLKEVEQEELERGYTTTCQFPQKHANQLIGKRGENINRLREEFDVDINVDREGKVEIKGPQAKAERCKSHILNLGKKLEDEVFYTIKVESKYHRDLIGPKGASVRKLEERYGVHIQFPSSKSIADDQSVADTASEVGGGQRRGRNQPADEIFIRGPKKSADEARSEVLELVQYYKDRSFEASVSVAKKQVPSLMGRGGNEMESIRGETGAQIDVPSSQESTDPSGRVDIKIRGTKAQVDKAKTLLQQRVKAFDEITQRSIDVDKKYHQALIGSGGQTIRRIVLDAGGPENSARVVRFPDRNSDSSIIRIEGPSALVNKVYDSIDSFVKQKENQTSDTIDVPTEKHSMLIGRGGEVRRNIQSQFNVSVDIPKQGSGKTDVKILGASSDVSKAKDHIANLVKDQDGETIQVPRSLHHSLAQNGSFFRKLRADHEVTVDHAGQRPPPRPKTTPRQRPSTNGATPLITDDPGAAADAYSWAVVENSPASNGNTEGSIPWILSGSNPEQVAKAKALVEKALAEASKPSFIGSLTLPDPRSYRLVVGPGGREINRIREKTGCTIQVPKAQGRAGDGDEAIEITGSKEGVEQAKEMILETVQSG